MVLTDEGKEDQYPPASLEEDRVETERRWYNIPADATGSRVPKSTVPYYPQTDYRTLPNDYIQKLQGNATKIGTSIVLKVMSGDKFNVSASSWYKTNNTTPGNPTTNPISDLVSALASGLSSAATAGGHSLTPTEVTGNNILQPGLTSFFSDPEIPAPVAGRPKAYLNWILVDENFVYVDGGVEQVPNEAVYENGTANVHVYPHQMYDIPVTKNGYLYAYVSNETTNIPVFFDNLQVVHYKGVLFEETHYYPFGLVLSGISSKAANITPNKIKYNNMELQSEEFSDGMGLEMYEYKYRFYDHQIGRFISQDKLADKYPHYAPYQFAGNQVPNAIDLDGLEEYRVIDNDNGTRAVELTRVNSAFSVVMPDGSRVNNFPQQNMRDFVSQNTVVRDNSLGQETSACTPHSIAAVVVRNPENGDVRTVTDEQVGSTNNSGNTYAIKGDFPTTEQLPVSSTITQQYGMPILQTTNLEALNNGALNNVSGTTVNGTTNYVVDYASMGSTNLTFTITQSNPTTGAAVGTPIILNGSSPLGSPAQIQLQTGVNVNVNVSGQTGAPVDNAFRVKINVNPN
jgi:RHS repeat-associated protein